MKGKYDTMESDVEKILFRKDIGKREKIKQMFLIYEKKYPDEDKESIMKGCIKYYEYKILRKNPDTYSKEPYQNEVHNVIMRKDIGKREKIKKIVFILEKYTQEEGVDFTTEQLVKMAIGYYEDFMENKYPYISSLYR